MPAHAGALNMMMWRVLMRLSARLETGLAILAEVKTRTGLPVTTDVHLPEQCGPAAASSGPGGASAGKVRQIAYVVPQVVSVYQQSRQTLPLLTRALIAASGFFRDTAWMWLAGIAAAAVADGGAGMSTAMRKSASELAARAAAERAEHPERDDRRRRRDAVGLTPARRQPAVAVRPPDAARRGAVHGQEHADRQHLPCPRR